MIRPARAADIPAIHQMILELATYERSLPEVSATEDDLRAALLAGAEEPGGPGGRPGRPWTDAPAGFFPCTGEGSGI